MKLIYIFILLFTSCSLFIDNTDNRERDILKSFLKCDKDLIQEDLLICIEASVEGSSIQIDTIIGNLTSKGEIVLSDIVQCVNSTDFSKNKNCKMKFIFDRHGTKNHMYSSHQTKIKSFKNEHQLQIINVVNSTYYNN